MLAAMAYERSIEIFPVASTCYNLAVCRDDMGQNDRAGDAMPEFPSTPFTLGMRNISVRNLESVMRQWRKRANGLS